MKERGREREGEETRKYCICSSYSDVLNMAK